MSFGPRLSLQVAAFDDLTLDAPIHSGSAVLSGRLGFGDTSMRGYWENFGVTLAFTAAWRILALFALRRRCRS